MFKPTFKEVIGEMDISWRIGIKRKLALIKKDYVVETLIAPTFDDAVFMLGVFNARLLILEEVNKIIVRHYHGNPIYEWVVELKEIRDTCLEAVEMAKELILSIDYHNSQEGSYES